MITLPNGLLNHLQQSKLLDIEVHAQFLSATLVMCVVGGVKEAVVSVTVSGCLHLHWLHWFSRNLIYMY